MIAARFLTLIVSLICATAAVGQGAPAAGARCGPDPFAEPGTAPPACPAAPPAGRPTGQPIERSQDAALSGPLVDRARRAQAEGRLAEAEAAYRELLRATEAAHGRNAVETAQALGMLAGFYERQLRFSDAEALERRQLRIVVSHYALWRSAGRHADILADAQRRGLDPYGEALAENLLRQGRRAEADVMWARVHADRQAAGDTQWEPPELAVRPPPGGLPGILPSVPPERAAMEARRGEVGRLLEARSFAEAEALARTLPGGEAEPWDAYLLAESLRGQRRFEEAQPLLEGVLAGPGLRNALWGRVDVMLSLADTRLQRNDVAGAERLYREVGDIYAREVGPHYPDTLGFRTMVAYLLGQQGRYREAADAYRQICVGRVERMRVYSRGSAVGEGTASRTADAADCGRRLANALRRVALTEAAASDVALRDEAFVAAQLFQQSAAGDSLSRAGARRFAELSGAAGLSQRYEDAVAARSALDADGREAAATTAAERARLDAEIARLAVDLADRQPLYWDLRAPEPLSVATLQATPRGAAALLRADEALVVFMVPRGEIRGLVFAISRQGAAWADIPMTGDELAARVRTLRGQIDPLGYGVEQPDNARASRAPGVGVPFDRQSAWELYQALLGDPAIQAVIREPGTLLIVPSGPLTSLPPGLLVTAAPEGGAAADASQAVLRRTPWLLRSKAIALLPSVSALRTLRRLLPTAQRPTEPLLAFADPEYSGPVASAPVGTRLRAMDAYFRDGRPLGEMLRSLPPLPGTAHEGAALARALGASPDSVLTGRLASKAALLERNRDGRLGRVRVLEFATHGLIAGDATGLTEPSLVLAAGAAPEDGLLTASEAARLRLNADWVLLSACNTASPDASGADGLSGLARAFFHAGARSMLVSHWRVNDGIAPVLVPAIIDAMARDPSITRAVAVQRASLAILDATNIPAAHPALWAPFTLIGEAGR